MDHPPFLPSHDRLCGIDSDGCVFPTMELKHKECFIPEFIHAFGLQSVSSAARQTWEFINLYSRDRGINRFPALLKTLELLGRRPLFASSGLILPDLSDLRAFIASGLPQSNAGLKTFLQSRDSHLLRQVLAWSEAVNAAIDRMVVQVPPFPSARKAVTLLAEHTDLLVVSGTPTAALEKEWTEHGLATFVKAIRGQEAGSKTDHLSSAMADRYPPQRVLMIGDAPGDHKAAQTVGASFFPINPGAEEESWRHFLDEGLPRFLENRFDAAYQDRLLRAFYDRLPEHPPFDITTP